ncbi:hypothetical protein FLAG1_02174 [Fusarium langsethiae]|uniref:Pentatricopeptide repeat protein n=1 Tax=Fusarium langsethiae TaxID=179993 RepID=A0A0M9F2N4_FUSLA|nr:hypothetical protein FLAG1_02174 [Fusarium langsethiae]GKU02414.1 unnamed protein product [Fusarium langsethiae]GKU12449.1 unnamed protein product [Fusarium langsethiae]
MADKLIYGGACLRRALQLVPRQRLAARPVLESQCRSFHQAQSTFDSTTAKPAKTTPTAKATTTVITNSQTPKKINRDIPRSLGDGIEDLVSAEKAKLRKERAAKQELKYLGDDPWKFSQYVKKALEKGKFEEAYYVVQTGSRNLQLVVPWTLLMDHLLQQQQLTRAIKIFNEMKKRAQFPNALTYTTLFRGLARSQHPKMAVAEAVKQYNNLLKDSRLEPNTTHLNAVLNVCNRAGDLDSMFSIVDTVNDSTRSASAYTYSIIISALRWNIQKDIKDLTDEQKEFNIRNALQRAKVIWGEAMSKWRQGRLVIDEELVSSMCRLMLMSSDVAEKRDILDIVEQTMNVPNLSKIQERSAADARKTDPKTGAVAKKDGNGVYATPGNNTLSLLLQVVLQTKQSSIGIKYWNFLVREHNMEPDRDCWMRLFSILKQARASAHATEILSIVPQDIIGPRIYRIAMETCIRDNINQNVIKNADRALDNMVERIEIPDPQTMRLYLVAVQNTHYHLRTRANEGDVAGAKRAYGIQVTKALDRLWVPYRKLHDHFFRDVKTRKDQDEGILYNQQREVIALARIMYGSFNKVIQQEMLPEEDLQRIRPIGGRINREIQAFFAKREEKEPNLRKTKGRGAAEEEMSEYYTVMEVESFWDTTQAGRPPREGKYEDRRSRGYDNDRRRPNEDRRGIDSSRSNLAG